MKKLFCIATLFATVSLSRATMLVGPWTPLYQGVDHVVATNCPPTTVVNNGVTFVNNNLQVVHCVRIDLFNPGVRLFATPQAPGWIAQSRETLSESINTFIRTYGVQVAADANFYTAFPGGSDPSSEGIPCEVDGFMMSTGQVVSAAEPSRTASFLFDSTNGASILLNNSSPGNTAGIYNAVSGFYPVLTNGVNVWALYFSAFSSQYPDQSIHGRQPRTAYGLSQDRRYLYMMTIDGRQPDTSGTPCGSGYSNGALDAETAMWMLQFEVWDAINMDGGGSTAMYMADCAGNPVALNHSSLIGNLGRERYLGAHFGVYAQPLQGPLFNIVATPGATNAIVTWNTANGADSQVEYGLTTSYGTFTTLDNTFVTSHTVTLSGLNQSTRYYYRVRSSDGINQYISTCGILSFTTTNLGTVGLMYGLTNKWKYTTANLDGVNWQAPGYVDDSWIGPTQGVLWADQTGAPGGQITFLPINPQGMPLDLNTGYPFFTYYFRTHFTYTNNPVGSMLTFSNYIDDGAVFYLNGVQLKVSPQLFVSGGVTGNGGDSLPTPASNSSLASGFICSSGNANCPYVFTISGDLATNLYSGDNVVAVEVHNFSAHSPDVTFGQALIYTAPPAPPPPPPPPPFITNVLAFGAETNATITWTTLSNSTSQVLYGLTAGLGSSTPVDSTLVTNHSVTLSGLLPVTNYFFRVVSSIGNTQYTSDGTFATRVFYVTLVSLTNIWAYQTNNLDGVNWTSPDYDESLFPGVGPALLYIETNPAVAPRNTPLPATSFGIPFPTYYFRTHFVFNTNLAGLSLTFSNYIDDGAVFYLNGAEIQRVRMIPAPQTVRYTNYTTGCPHPIDCDAVTNAPDLFRIGGDLMRTNLIANGDNVLAVEVHQLNAGSADVVFGSAVGLVRALVSETKLRAGMASSVATISWDGTGFTLQQSSNLVGSSSWSDVPGPVKQSPYAVTNPPAATFYRLRN